MCQALGTSASQLACMVFIVMNKVLERAECRAGRGDEQSRNREMISKNRCKDTVRTDVTMKPDVMAAPQ